MLAPAVSIEPDESLSTSAAPSPMNSSLVRNYRSHASTLHR